MAIFIGLDSIRKRQQDCPRLSKTVQDCPRLSKTVQDYLLNSQLNIAICDCPRLPKIVNCIFFKMTGDDNENGNGNDAEEFESLKAPALATPAGA